MRGNGRKHGLRLSRRGFLQAAGGAAIGTTGLVLGACGGGDDGRGASAGAVATQPTAAGNGATPAGGPVQQQKQLRMRTGVTAWDSTKTFDGYTLFAPNRGTSAYAVDMNGEVVNTWDLQRLAPDAHVWSVDLLENGNLFALLQRPSDDAPVFIFKGGLIMEVDWDGNVVWQLVDDAQHHDAKLLPNGNLLILRTEAIPPDLAARVQGGLPGTEGDQGMWADWVAEVTLDGEVLWEWHAWEHLEPEIDRIHPQDQRNEWTHGNAVDQFPNGDVIISFRNINTVAIVDRPTGDIVWKLTAPAVAQQHDAHVLPNGNIMIFDNGAHRLDGSIPYSRVLEVDRETQEVVWAWQDAYLPNFFSPFISGAQRLPNGNTLITEGNFGRVFEVTTEGEVVWEYVNPFTTVDQLLGENNSIFRAHRYAVDAFATGR